MLAGVIDVVVLDAQRTLYEPPREIPWGPKPMTGITVAGTGKKQVEHATHGSLDTIKSARWRLFLGHAYALLVHKAVLAITVIKFLGRTVLLNRNCRLRRLVHRIA